MQLEDPNKKPRREEEEPIPVTPGEEPPEPISAPPDEDKHPIDEDPQGPRRIVFLGY